MARVGRPTGFVEAVFGPSATVHDPERSFGARQRAQPRGHECTTVRLRQSLLAGTMARVDGTTVPLDTPPIRRRHVSDAPRWLTYRLTNGLLHRRTKVRAR
jgi:hypothetical protein